MFECIRVPMMNCKTCRLCILGHEKCHTFTFSI